MAYSPSEFWHGGLAEAPSDAQFSSGPRASFAQAFAAAYDDQANNWSMLGLGAALSQAEQKQLDAIYAATGQRLQPLLDQNFFVAMAKRANGDPLTPTDEEYLAAIKPREDSIAKLRETHPEIPDYDEMWNGVKAQAQQYDQTAQEVGSRERSFGGWMGDVFGRLAGSFTYRDPLNLVTLGVGGVGRAALTRVATDAGFVSLPEALNQFTGVQRNRELLGLEHGTGQALEQIALAGVGAGVFRSVGEGVAAIGKSIAGRAASRTSKDLVDAARVAEEGEEVAGGSPFGDSRVAEGVHQAELADTIRRFDTPGFVPPTDRGDLMAGVSIPTLASRESDGMFTASGSDAWFVGTSNPLKNLVVKDIPALRASASAADRAVADQFGDLSSRVAINDVKESALKARLDAVAAKATPAETVRQMLNDLAATNKKLADLGATTEAASGRRLAPEEIEAAGQALVQKPVKVPKAVAKQIKKLRAAKAALETGLAKAQAVAADVRTLTSARDTVSATGNDLRLQRARLVAQQARKRPPIGTPPPTAEQEALVRDLLGTSKPGELTVRRPGTAATADAAEKAQKVLDDREVETPKVITPEVDEATGKPREGAVETVDVGQKGPPVDLDHPIATGAYDDDGKPVMTTLRAMLEDMKDDDDLVHAMRECLL